MMFRESASAVVVGTLIGLALAAVAGRAGSGLLFGITPHDPTAVGTAAWVLTGSALLAGYVASRRAAHVDPVRALGGS